MLCQSLKLGQAGKTRWVNAPSDFGDQSAYLLVLVILSIAGRTTAHARLVLTLRQKLVS
jgi:hypothetical protein